MYLFNDKSYSSMNNDGQFEKHFEFDYIFL